ncbi:hypothetical protein [Deinococcus sp. AJ005]|uniref:hypothetical protein n=1 Tax=Deinococcus sp. AJ005 TaxID=2652443 RepID=UPI00125CB5B8|nr:hypothetical protein [Deinococcus sp. AJ005]QFP76282.1 hypothetical protein DAAJ005_07335 [Deinococcus sp. AJ005]
MNGDPAFIPPLHIPLQRLSVTYSACFTDFLKAARDAAKKLRTDRQPPWHVDGYKSDALFLVCRHPDGAMRYPQITAHFDLQISEDAVTVEVFSRSESLLGLYRDYIWQLNMLLPRRLS